MKPISRRGVLKVAGGLVAFLPAARMLTQPPPAAADYCGCGIPDDCECDCALSYSEVQIPCFYPCDPPYPGCTAPIFEVVQYQCCNYIGIACGGTATVIARIPCPY